MKKGKCCDLETCLMCRLVLKEWKLTIDSHRKNFIAKKGEQIFKEGDPVAGVYFVYKGNVKVHKHWGDKELIVRFANDGKIFGHRGLGTYSSVYPISATALEETTLCFIDLEFFMATLKVNHDFAFNLMLFYADELQESEKKMRNLALMSVKNRLAVALLQLKDQFGLTEAGNLNIELSKQDLAAFTGATYETVFRMTTELVNENLIALSGKQIAIINEEKLRFLTQES
ncbi:Crp/Fnr family transcriptional regulator [Pedobacter nyackensis]|uniref:cAMP-binding domain of CRP or a regulatory subunit of cAMP-dependent protein kinases n=1 Tax=Pedobacter nyackensis TaxID=475255 RepID=A0A1W2EBW5_9SPHI|nr:Crp/Fnr family transcriptional regulator [Pedobacter nyackensis]SMD07145.1 cAMP-binding domain of CRP or a regulatory subunit of cAMP-dependent protein kinases [Pedobacter nyackensis]